MKMRFLLFVLITALVPLLGAFVATVSGALHASDRLEERVSMASSALQSQLDAEGARRRELLLRLVQLPAVSAPVREAAAARQPPSAASVVAVRETIGGLLRRPTPELMALATARGVQVLVTNGEPRLLDVQDLPLASATLSPLGAQSTEMFALFEGVLYRFFAAPLGVADGALILGDRVGDATAVRLREAARADVSFVVAGRTAASSLSSERRGDVVRAADRPHSAVSHGALLLGPGLKSLEGVFPVAVPKGAYRSLAAEVGAGVMGVVTARADRELGWLARVQIGALATSLGLLFIGLAWLRVMYGPVARQARSLEAHLARLRAERHAKLSERGFAPPFVAVVRQLDALVAAWESEPDSTREAASLPPEAPRPLRPLDLPLASAPQTEPTAEPGAFPFGLEPAPEPVEPSGLPFSIGAAPPESPVIAAPHLLSEPSGPVELPAPARPAPSWPTPPFEREEVTGAAAFPSATEAADESDPDEAHFRQVYEDFLSTRRQCGEPSEGLTQERFVARLKKNREQLVEKYSCRSVRFQVYVKEGKAALKASPLR